MSATLADPLVLRAPFAARFADAATGAPLRDSALRVRLLGGGSSVDAIPNRSGAYVAHRLPNASGAVRVALTDRAMRFLPFSFDATLPTSAGFVTPACVDAPLVPLFSAPVREPPSALAAVRVSLRDAVGEAPAAFAVLDLSLGARRIGRAVADAAGEALAVFPWPDPEAGPLSAQLWTLRLDLRWARNFAATAPRDPADGAKLPDYCATLAQPIAALRDAARAEFPGMTLRFGGVQTLPPLFVDP